MEKYRLGVCDTDTDYVDALMNYMNTHKDIPYKVIMFSSVQDIHRYMEHNSLDLLLLGEKVEGQDDRIPTVILGESPDIISNYIYKYQSVQDISRKLSYIMKSGNLCEAGYDNNGFLAVLCIEGGISLSGHIDRLKTVGGKNVVVKLEEYRSVADVTENEELFIYYLLSHNEDILRVINEISNTKDDDEPLIINGPLSYFDIEELRKSDVMWFRDVVKSSNAYRLVFMIEGGVLSDIDILEAFDCVYVPYCSGGRSIERLNSFKKLIGYSGEDEPGCRIRFVRMEELDSAYRGDRLEGKNKTSGYEADGFNGESQ